MSKYQGDPESGVFGQSSGKKDGDQREYTRTTGDRPKKYDPNEKINDPVVEDEGCEDVGDLSISAPLNVSATTTQIEKITISWSAVGGASGYMLYKGEDQELYKIFGSDVLEYTDENVAFNTEIPYWVRAFVYRLSDE